MSGQIRGDLKRTWFRHIFFGLILAFSLANGTEITQVAWDPDLRVIHILLDAWPGRWGGWRFFLDGAELPMEGGIGKPVIRPDAPLDQPPTGLFVGTLPWPSALDRVDFPCCGTIQLFIPGEGFTKPFVYNLHDFSCKTASTRECPSEWKVHEGDLVVQPGETRVIEGVKFFQKGHVYIKGGGTLIIRNTEFAMARGAVPTVHVYFFVNPGGKLLIENSRIHSPAGGTDVGLICLWNYGEVRIVNSPTEIHYLHMFEGAKFRMEHSEMVNPIGGLLQVEGGDTYVADSTIAALGLLVPAGSRLEAKGLHSGMYFERWDVQELIKGVAYRLVLERVTLLKDELPGELKHGPYERGWIFFLDPAAHVRLSECELRKVFLQIRNDTVEFRNLRVGVPASLRYRDIVLENVVVMGQWPFEVDESRVTLESCNYLFLQPHGHSIVKLVNSHMVEFIPRDFFGTLICENAEWTNAGEIIGGVPYHSQANRFTIVGSLRIGQELRENLQWQNAQVTREFEVIVTDQEGKPLQGVRVAIAGQSCWTGPEGRASFRLMFDEKNYNQPAPVEIWQGEKLLARFKIDFFTATPLKVAQP
jgi:hypothetical protein